MEVCQNIIRYDINNQRISSNSNFLKFEKNCQVTNYFFIKLQLSNFQVINL